MRANGATLSWISAHSIEKLLLPLSVMTVGAPEPTQRIWSRRPPISTSFPVGGGGAQEVMEIVHRLLDRVLCGTAVAPGEAGAVVGADARECRDFVLDQRPLDGEAAAAALGNDGGCTGADAADMEPAAADIDELPRR